MIKYLIKKDATYTIDRNKLIIGGTNYKHLGDLLADILLMVPKDTIYGKVSWSVYQQAEEIYKQVGHKLISLPAIYLSGHSLGGSVALLLGLILRENGYSGKLHLSTTGSPKVLGLDTRWNTRWVFNSISCRVRDRDIVPDLGWWHEPIHSTPVEGDKKQHLLDYDFKEHIMY